jgi:hypothetical protein
MVNRFSLLKPQLQMAHPYKCTLQERPGGPGTQVLNMRRFLIFAASLSFLPAIVFAQGRGGGGHAMGSGMAHAAMSAPAMSRSAMAVPHYAMRSSPSVGSHYYGSRAYPGMHYVRTRSGAIALRPIARQPGVARTPRNNRAILSEDVPGLGFDYTHLAAVHPRGSGDRDHGHRRDRGFIGGYFPFYGGYYDWPLFGDDTDDYDAGPADEAQQMGNGESEPPQEAEAPPPYHVARNYAPASQPAVPQDTDEYVFVRRDGTLFFATAFAWENGTLRYITREGLRRTMSLDQLDLNASQKFNEQRGLNFRLPA